MQQLHAGWLSRLLSSSTASCSQRTPSSSPLGHGWRKRADAEGDDKATSTPVYLLRSQYAYDDEGQAQNKLKFVSRERRLVPRPPFYRPPIYFPDIRLQMLKLTDEQRQQIKVTGWTREVAFKTTPNVTKLEIKGVLESMYGMQVCVGPAWGCMAARVCMGDTGPGNFQGGPLLVALIVHGEADCWHGGRLAYGALLPAEEVWQSVFNVRISATIRTNGALQ